MFSRAMFMGALCGMFLIASVESATPAQHTEHFHQARKLLGETFSIKLKQTIGSKIDPRTIQVLSKKLDALLSQPEVQGDGYLGAAVRQTKICLTDSKSTFCQEALQTLKDFHWETSFGTDWGS